MICVGSFYYDLHTWATDEPERWAHWVAPCPVPPSEIRGLGKRRRRINERSADRTRQRQRLLPLLVQHIESRYDRARALLEHARQAQEGETFHLAGCSYQRVITSSDRHTRRRSGGKSPVRVVDEATGELIHIEPDEEAAFWDWACVETLRHSGVRIEELCADSPQHPPIPAVPMPAGPGAHDLTEFFAHIDAKLDPDDANAPKTQRSDREILSLLTKRAHVLHLGVSNYCRFTDPSRALCPKLAGTPTADKPFIGMCDSARCPQATHHPCHRPVWADHADRTKAFLCELGPTRRYGTRPYNHLREESEARHATIREAGDTPDPRDAQITRLKAEITTLKERLTRREESIQALTDFRDQALSRLAEQHDELLHLRRQADRDTRIRRLRRNRPMQLTLASQTIFETNSVAETADDLGIWSMTTAEASTYPPGQTALIAKVPEAEPLVGHWRSQLDSFASDGVPAHVTILFPFLDYDRLDENVISQLGTLIGAHSAFNIQFKRCGRFPGVLYLAPSPDQPFRALTEAVAERWPEAPPYEGQFAEITPHLTIAHQQEPQLLERVEAELANKLPLTAHVHEVQLLVSDGSRWHEDRTFELQRLG